MTVLATRTVSLQVRLLATTLVTALLTGLLVGSGPSPASAGPSAAAYATEALAATNHERTRRDRRPLATDACLTRHARRQAVRMADAGRIFHSSNLAAVARACGLRAWGENVARSLSTDDGRGVVQLWMASSGHRRNLLDGTYRRGGLAAVKSGGGWWVVQILGRRK